MVLEYLDKQLNTCRSDIKLAKLSDENILSAIAKCEEGILNTMYSIELYDVAPPGERTVALMLRKLTNNQPKRLNIFSFGWIEMKLRGKLKGRIHGDIDAIVAAIMERYTKEYYKAAYNVFYDNQDIRSLHEMSHKCMFPEIDIGIIIVETAYKYELYLDTTYISVRNLI